MAEAPHGQFTAGAGPVVLREGRVLPVALYGGLLAVFLLALLRGLAGASSTGGRMAVAVIFGVLAALAASAGSW
jgi:hypothetical protein